MSLDTDDNYVSFGTALDPIEEEEVARKKPILVSEQIATDEKGRRRFHGAFTGGFSAGYFNSVGSKEGWQPSTFKSSRDERFSSKNQNVTDFMDEEDMGAFGIAPQVLRPTDEFSTTEQNNIRKRPKAPQSDGPIPGTPVLHQIIEPVIETVGIKILMKMGWKPGQGVGPRVAKTKDKSKTKGKQSTEEIDKPTIVEIDGEEDVPAAKTYGCQLPPGVLKTTDASSDEEIDSSVLYAPEDVDSPLCNPKENTFGLGYKGLERMTATSGHIDLFGKQLKFRSENQEANASGVTGEAFGIGAFEEPDIDVYTREDMSQYDFELETMEERRARKIKEVLSKNKKKLRDKCIEGFRLSTSTTSKKKYFPPPHLPHDFQPIHTQRKSRFEEAPPKTDDTDNRNKGRHALTIQERQVLLGETTTSSSVPKIPENVPSISESLPSIVKSEPLESTKSNAPPILPDQSVVERVERIKKFVQVLQAHSSAPTLDTSAVSKPEFKPFIKNPEKQDRYDKYLTLVASGFQNCIKDLQPPTMTEWERQREQQEFERAAAMYKPLSGVMSSRFVSAKSHDISHVVPDKEVLKEKDATEDPKVAARLNLFGKLTHTIVEWHPDKLLCKRFNIKDPFPDSKFVGLRGSASKMFDSSTSNNNEPDTSVTPTAAAQKKSLFDNLDFSKPPPGLLPLKSSLAEPPPPGTDDGSAVTPPRLKPTENLEFQANSKTAAENEDIIPIVKAPLDLFKQIFADSSESEEDLDEPPMIRAKSPINQSHARDQIEDKSRKRADLHGDDPKSSSSHRVEQHLSSFKKDHTLDRAKGGIFENLDFSKLNHHGNKTRESKRETANTRDEDDESGEDELYGPRVPSQISITKAPSKSINSSSTYSTSSSNVIPPPSKDDDIVWVEKETIKSSKRVKSKHSIKKSKSKKSKKISKSKHKSKKSKKRSKKSKKSRGGHSDSSSDSSSDEDERKKNRDDESSDDSSSSIIINSSLDQKALLAQLAHITRSH